MPLAETRLLVVVREGVRWLGRRGGRTSVGLCLMRVWGARRVRRSGLAGEMPLARAHWARVLRMNLAGGLPLVRVHWTRVLRMRYRQLYALVVVPGPGCPTHVVGRLAQAVVVLGLVQVL